MPYARLADRAVLTVTGDPAHSFLQNLVTLDLDQLAEDEVRPSALLTPQGKILFDFLVSRRPEGFRLDCAAAARGDLVKRLTLYRLRAKIAIEPRDEPVFATWGVAGNPAASLVDRRFAGEDVGRVYGAPPPGLDEADAAAFEAMRIRAGIAEAEKDFPGSDVFPHDVLLDQNGGVSFKKGCFVGQEVVSRMQHRGTARRRIMIVQADGHLSAGANVDAGERAVGTVLSASGDIGMALVRIDKVGQALAQGETLSVDGVPVEISVPSWAGYSLPDPSAADAVPSEAE